jgi:hypothetical protein
MNSLGAFRVLLYVIITFGAVPTGETSVIPFNKQAGRSVFIRETQISKTK